MKAVLDEGVPRDLAKLLLREGCDVTAFPNAWKGTKNGRLLALIGEAGFDCLVTADKNLQRQQNIAKSDVAIVLLSDPQLQRLAGEVAPIAKAVATAERGTVQTVIIPLHRAP